MTLIQAILLGLIQGLTEFFPISSSAHLRLAKWLMGMADGEHFLFFDLVCHSGTLLALVWILRKEIWEVLTSIQKMTLFTVALLPLVPAYFLLKPLRVAASDPSYLGFCLIATAAILFAASRKRGGNDENGPKWKHVLCIGVMQTMALIPGISRSGSTIAAGRFCGWQWKESAKFSFLLAVPTIVGGQILETVQLMRGHSEAMGAVSMACYVGGFTAALGLGSVAARFVFWVYEKGVVRPFAWYCLILGLFAWAFFHG
jgi:undecaprenyl-diphosphatase